MNKEQKAAVVDELAEQIEQADAVFAIDYRGLSVTQAVDLRARLGEVDAAFRVVKNRLTSRAVDKAGVESLKELLEGPTAFTFVRGDAALAAKALAGFRREHQLLEFKGGTMEGEPLTVDQIEAIARLPGRDALHGQFVGMLASPLTGLVRGLGGLIQGLALQLGQIREQGLVGDESEETSAEAEADRAEAEAEAAPDEQPEQDASDEAEQKQDASEEAEEEDS
jgi:large subunit ribosomal protein L10